MSSQFGIVILEWDDHVQDFVKDLEVEYPGLFHQVRDHLDVYGYYNAHGKIDKEKLYNYTTFIRILGTVIQAIDNQLFDCRRDMESAAVYSPQDMEEKNIAVEECREILELIEEDNIVIGKLSGMMALADSFSFDAGREDKHVFGFTIN